MESGLEPGPLTRTWTWTSLVKRQAPEICEVGGITRTVPSQQRLRAFRFNGACVVCWLGECCNKKTLAAWLAGGEALGGPWEGPGSSGSLGAVGAHRGTSIADALAMIKMEKRILSIPN